ncbi:hypothetical protein BDB00DRAFT_869222 [Zychaea mexicana]|uniref:uncharacterized protein n=1 Tax=Zychaea mexicana TaxID=64656 RepID=UPI0022FDB6D6|nr:uncharacterized protein BDB00DRAFT_869222 [Zychaea mexicana]KAI9496646.1 hypothetical protein BDB00DRAFT_869222 [Zychaea mexicana]
MKFFTIAAAVSAVFAVSAVASPYENGRDNDLAARRWGGGDDTVQIKGCEGQGDITGVLPAVLQAGVLSNNKKYCIQEVDDVDH